MCLGVGASNERDAQLHSRAMLIVGLKLSHDGAVAAVEDGRLLFSIEAEKIDNRKRYASLGHLHEIDAMLTREGIERADVDAFVVDGWFDRDSDDLTKCVSIPIETTAGRRFIRVGPYHERIGDDVGKRYVFRSVEIDVAGGGSYASYSHVAGHVFSTYCTSPFAVRGERALVIVWDGAIFPRLYGVDPAARAVTSMGPLFPVGGSLFGHFSSCLPLFAAIEAGGDELGVAGKAMAYAGLGQSRPDVVDLLREEVPQLKPVRMDDAQVLVKLLVGNAHSSATDADLIASLQDYLGSELVSSLQDRFDRDSRVRGYENLCLSGGCALNIKWNSRIRASGLAREVWVPPFPNDSGSALGMACAEMVSQTGNWLLDWEVFRGPSLDVTGSVDGWSERPCRPEELGRLLHTTGEALVVLKGRAELGPRALGHRSILAPAIRPEMKDFLNEIKGREGYRPVAPICREDDAPALFAPGLPDPYMLFDHQMRAAWQERIPAVLHLDGTARLQTVSPSTAAFAWQVLSAYREASGIPVLCNTSANFKGRGFFPSAASAMEWGRVDRVWADGRLYEARGSKPKAMSIVSSTGSLPVRAR